MDAQILLADAAQTSPDGKVHALGLGWSATQTPTLPQAVIVLIKVPWDASNDPHSALVELQDEDGRPVTVAGPSGEQPLQIRTDFETGRPPGLPKGTALDVPLSFNVGGGLPLAPGRYVWRLTIDGDSQEGWQVPFLVRASRPGH